MSRSYRFLEFSTNSPIGGVDRCCWLVIEQPNLEKYAGQIGSSMIISPGTGKHSKKNKCFKHTRHPWWPLRENTWLWQQKAYVSFGNFCFLYYINILGGSLPMLSTGARFEMKLYVKEIDHSQNVWLQTCLLVTVVKRP